MAKCKECNNSFGFLELKNGICKQCTIEKAPPCRGCGANFEVSDLVDGYCSSCHVKQLEKRAAQKEERERMQKAERLRNLTEQEFREIILTTETVTNLEITKRIEIISAECVFGMNIFKDLFAGVRDIVGGRNKSTQNVLGDARKTVLNELKKEALSLGANGVVGVDLDYSEISGGGKSMLFVVASGTAVKIKIRENTEKGLVL